MNTLLYKVTYICYTSFVKEKYSIGNLSAIGVYPQSMFTLRCNFTTCNFDNFVEFWAELFLRINLSSYFLASYPSGILRISGVADLQHWIFLKFSDILLMFSLFWKFSLFWNKKWHHGGKSILINFYESLRKNPSRVPFFINLKKLWGRVDYWLLVRAKKLVSV